MFGSHEMLPRVLDPEWHENVPDIVDSPRGKQRQAIPLAYYHRGNVGSGGSSGSKEDGEKSKKNKRREYMRTYMNARNKRKREREGKPERPPGRPRDPNSDKWFVNGERVEKDYHRFYRWQNAIAAGREPGRIGRPEKDEVQLSRTGKIMREKRKREAPEKHGE